MLGELWATWMCFVFQRESALSNLSLLLLLDLLWSSDGRARNIIRGSRRQSLSCLLWCCGGADPCWQRDWQYWEQLYGSWYRMVSRSCEKGASKVLACFPFCGRAERVSLLTSLFMGSSKAADICLMHLDVREQTELLYAQYKQPADFVLVTRMLLNTNWFCYFETVVEILACSCLQFLLCLEANIPPH